MSPVMIQFYKVLAISQLRGILNQNRRVQELNKLKRLYESTATTFLLDRSADDTDNEDSYTEFEDASEDNEDTISLWTSISDDDSEENNLSSSELTDINNKSLVNEEYI
ncbi:17588_t:CDS:2, partial [Gigaspora margarita]